MSDLWKRLKPWRRKEDGRARYTVKRTDGSYRRCYGSALILEAFIGPRPDGFEACHENGNCQDDSAGNLRWDTVLANKADMKRHGTVSRGEKSGMAKLTELEVIEIRKMREEGLTLRVIAKQFKVTETLISYISNRRIWKHVP